MTDPLPVESWETDFDVLHPDYKADPFSIWNGLRSGCPVTHSTRQGRTWLPTRYQDVVDVAHDIEHFSSADPFLGDPADEPILLYGLPPLSADPPLHTWARRILLPWFSHQRVEDYEPTTRKLCAQLIDGFIADGRADAATDYAQQIPVWVIADILGVPAAMSDTFTGWVRDVVNFGDEPASRRQGVEGLAEFFTRELALRKTDPGADLLTDIVQAELDGAPVEDAMALGIAAMVLMAGVDTTWSAIGASLWHLATHPGDQERLATDPDAVPSAIEEFLRAYSPVTMARVVTEDVEFGECPMKAGDKVLVNFPAANRDPEEFEDADRIDFDRDHNRHVAFGSGIHRCAGSNLARMVMGVALDEWLQRIPTFRLADGADGADVAWSGGHVRGPLSVPVVFT